MDMRELDRQALRAIARPMDAERSVKRVYWAVLRPEEGGILLDKDGQLMRFARPQPGQITTITAIEQRLEEIRPDPHFRRLYVGDLDELSDIAQTIAKQDILVCIEWQAENMPAHAYAYYHRACLSQRPVELPRMKKHYLLQQQILSPCVLCSGCGLAVN